MSLVFLTSIPIAKDTLLNNFNKRISSIFSIPAADFPVLPVGNTEKLPKRISFTSDIIFVEIITKDIFNIFFMVKNSLLILPK